LQSHFLLPASISLVVVQKFEALHRGRARTSGVDFYQFDLGYQDVPARHIVVFFSRPRGCNPPSLAKQPQREIMDEIHTASGESAERKALIDVSIESWRFARIFGRLISKLDAGEAPRYANQARYFLKKIDDGLEGFGLRIVSLEGQPYDTGMAVSALNIADFGPDDVLFVEQMVEPVVMGPDGLVRGGTAMLAKVNQ
jgi:hypothetical protein